MAVETTINALPVELLEEILLRLPLSPLLQSKQVCTKWKQATESRSFRRSYRSIAKLVETLTAEGPWAAWAACTLEAVDSDGNVLLLPQDIFLCTNFSCSKTGLMAVCSRDRKNLYVCNIFSNKREQVPLEPWGGYGDIAVFGFEDGRYYTLVCWDYGGTLYTLESGQREWTQRNAGIVDVSWTSHRVLGNSVYGFDKDDGRLLEYNVMGNGKLAAVDLSSEEEFEFEIADESTLVVWEDELYLLLMFCGKPQKLELWKISRSNGAVKMVAKHDVDDFDVTSQCIAITDQDGKLVAHFLDCGDRTWSTLMYDRYAGNFDTICVSKKSVQTCNTVTVTLS